MFPNTFCTWVATLGGNDIYSVDQGTSSSVTVTNLPTNGSTLHVRLWSFSCTWTCWHFNDYSYTAFGTGSGRLWMQRARSGYDVQPAPRHDAHRGFRIVLVDCRAAMFLNTTCTWVPRLAGMTFTGRAKEPARR